MHGIIKVWLFEELGAMKSGHVNIHEIPVTYGFLGCHILM